MDLLSVMTLAAGQWFQVIWRLPGTGRGQGQQWEGRPVVSGHPSKDNFSTSRSQPYSAPAAGAPPFSASYASMIACVMLTSFIANRIKFGCTETFSTTL